MEHAMIAPLLEPAAPKSVGMSGDQLDAASDYVQKMVEIGAIPLAEILVARHSKIVLHRCFVNSEVSAKGIEITSDSIFEVASITKVFCALLMMKQVEMGNVSLEIPVAEYIPEFGRFGKETVTPRHLLSYAGPHQRTGTSFV